MDFADLKITHPFVNATFSQTHRNITSINNKNMVVKRPACTLATAEIILIVLASIITIIVIFGNGFILWKLNPLANRNRKNYDILLLYLSTFDLLAAITMIARIYTEITKCSQKWPFGLIGCKIILPFYDISINISVCILVIISIDRCRSITMPFKTTITRGRIHLSVIISIVISNSVYFERFITAQIKNGTCGHYLDDSLLSLSPFLVWLIRDIVFLTVFTITSVFIQRTLSTNQLLKEHQKRKKEQSKKVLRILVIMQCVFSGLVLPYDVMSCISLGYVMLNKRHFAGENWQTFSLFSNYLYLLQMSNSLANCFIYARVHRFVHVTQYSNQSKKSRHSSKITYEPRNNDKTVSYS